MTIEPGDIIETEMWVIPSRVGLVIRDEGSYIHVRWITLGFATVFFRIGETLGGCRAWRVLIKRYHILAGMTVEELDEGLRLRETLT